MEPAGRLRDDVDERLLGLFEDDPTVQHKAVWELVERLTMEPDLEDALLEALETSLHEWNDDTQATAWIIVLLGELHSERSVPFLELGLVAEDELIVAAAVRALRKIGEVAFSHLLERLGEDAFDGESFPAALQALEGVRNHDLPGTRELIEDCLITYVHRPAQGRQGELRAESAALSLARIGSERARQEIERTHNQIYARRNSFLQEALDLLEEHPHGLPCGSETEWDIEFRWALGAEPGGPLEPLFGENEDE